MLPRRHGVGRPSRPIDYEEVLETRMPKEGSFDHPTVSEHILGATGGTGAHQPVLPPNPGA
jgi:hypothetical protein